MNFGRYTVEDSDDEENPPRGGERRAPASAQENPLPGYPHPQPGPREFRAQEDESTGGARAQPPYLAGSMRFPETSFAQPSGLPAYWSTAYSGPSSQMGLGPQLTLYSNYAPWSPPPQGPYLRSMARRRQATFVNARLKWAERGKQLLTKVHPDAVYSQKVFVGGLQAGTTNEAIKQAFQEFEVRGIIKKEREAHAYLIFESDAAVKKLLSRCEVNPDGAYFFPIGTRNVQVIPWAFQDAEWGREVDGQNNFIIFVGGLHGESTAEHLKIIMEENFGQVRHVKIDTDRFNYPSGSARVQFVFRASYLQAIEANYLEVNTKHYTRTVQLEPYFQRNRICSRCRKNISSMICRYVGCLNYFCRFCFPFHQQEQGVLSNLHLPVGLD